MTEQLVTSKGQIKRIPMYIQGLDEQMEGGIPEGHVNLIAGTAGTMKSTISFNIMYNEVKKGKIGLYVSLEQSCTSLLNHMVNVGYDLSKVNIFIVDDLGELDEKINKAKITKGALVMADMGVIRKEIKESTGQSGGWFNAIKNIVKRLKVACGCQLFVVDSLAALYVLSEFENPRAELFHAFEFFRDLNITTFLISEMPLDGMKYGQYEVEDFLADGVIKLELVARQRKITREISIVKMRKTSCSMDVFSLEVENGAFKAMYGGQTALI
ncbi:MAG: ATPase domain-containing protein [Nanoarchaeota archaeon]